MDNAIQTHDCRLFRRRNIRASDTVFGLDFISFCPTPGEPPRPRSVHLHFFGARPTWLTNSEQVNLRNCLTGEALPIEIGWVERQFGVEAHLNINILVAVCDDIDYEVSLNVEPNARPFLDPYFNCLTFRFASQQQAEVDCVPHEQIPLALAMPPEISYLAKDYATFRRLILDRLAVTLPNWQDRSPADIGMMLVEILAYAADDLSYYQDAVATEAYLNTARLRTSLRRHARLIDYRIHEGCNARAWVHLHVSSNCTIDNVQSLFFVALPRSHFSPATVGLQAAQLPDLLRSTPGCEVFEPVVSKCFQLLESHNECLLYDWGGSVKCLPRGATSACLINVADGLRFKVGDVIVFEEVCGPWTGRDVDANPSHRHVVRITAVDDKRDELFNKNLVQVTWDEADSLPFTLWISRPDDASWDVQDGPVSIARGNMLLVDHGRRIVNDPIDLVLKWDSSKVPEDFRQHYPQAQVTGTLNAANLTFSARLPKSHAAASAQLIQDPRDATPQLLLRPRLGTECLVGLFSLLELRDFRRVAKRLLSQFLRASAIAGPLRQAVRCVYHARQLCGDDIISSDESPLIELQQLHNAIQDDLHDFWMPRYDLLDSGPDDAHFVVEMTDERRAMLRFGRDGFGRIPVLSHDSVPPEMTADYRAGNGVAGNVPAEAICICGCYDGSFPEIEAVRNPLPAVGGADPESPTEIRLFSPHAIRTRLRRAITADDYEKIALHDFRNEVQSVKATLLWTGHEFEVHVAVDPRGREFAGDELVVDCKGYESRYQDCRAGRSARALMSKSLLEKIRKTLRHYRRIGHSVRVYPAERVVPTLGLEVCIESHVVQEEVRSELNKLFSNQVLADGSLAFFHPDRSTFGDGIFVSQIIAAVTSFLGARLIHVKVSELHRSDVGPAEELENAVLPLRPQEIVRFDNDRSHPEFGILRLIIKGGR